MEQMMELLISVVVGGLVAWVIFHYTKRYTKQLHEESKEEKRREESEKRILDVVDRYLINTSKASGIEGLIRAGIKNLKNDDEIKDALNRIENIEGKNVCQEYQKIEEFGLYRFFQNVTKGEIFKPGGVGAFFEKIKEKE